MIQINTCVTNATKEDHKKLLSLSHQHKATSSFSHMMFSSDDSYEKGWIRKLILGNEIIGFSCVRHKIREHETVLYFIIIDSNQRRSGYGNILLNDLYVQTPHNRIVLNCMKNNLEALSFYKKNGFFIVCESLKGTGYKLQKDLNKNVNSSLW